MDAKLPFDRMAELADKECAELLFIATRGRLRPLMRLIKQAALHALARASANVGQVDLAYGYDQIEPADGRADKPVQSHLILRLREIGMAPSRKPLPLLLRPVSGENVLGYARRLAGANGHLSMSVFAPMIGLTTKFGPMSAVPAWAPLIRAAELTEVETASMRWVAASTRPGNSKLTVVGVQTARGFVRPRQTRLCTSCLKEDGIRRDFWAFSIVAACPLHGDLLVTHCGCGQAIPSGVLGRTYGCICGIAWSDLPVTQAPDAVVKVARNLAARIGSASGYHCENDHPPPFTSLSAHDYMVVVYTLGTAATTPASADGPVKKATGTYRTGTVSDVVSFDATVASIKAASRIIDGWPECYTALLEGVEGRNTKTNTSTIMGAFATTIGKLLVSPIRGADGLPVRLLVDAVDRYWDGRGKVVRRRRKRNLSITDVTARRLQMRYNTSSLAKAVGQPNPTVFLGRILRRTLERLSDDERNLGDAPLSELVRRRSIALYQAAMAALPAEAAKEAVEGANGPSKFAGWDHPHLMPSDPALHSLRYKNKPSYTKAGVSTVLSRLRSVALRTTDVCELVPLTSVALRWKMLPWDNKTQVLLDIFEGQLPVYTTVDEPKLDDLLVKVEEFRQASYARNPASKAPDDNCFMEYHRANTVLEGRFGPVGRLTLSEFRRLRRGGLILSRTEQWKKPSGAVKQVFTYHLNQLIDIVGRLKGSAGLSAGEAEAFGRTVDLGPLLTTLYGLPLTTRRIEKELDSLGVKSEEGAKLEHEVIARALTRFARGHKVLGLVTGNAFSKDIVAIEMAVRKATGKASLSRYNRSSDLSNTEWKLLRPHLNPGPETSGSRKHPTREIFNALRYTARTGVSLSRLPDDLPPWHVVLDNSRRWIKRNQFEIIITALQAMLMPTLDAKDDRDQVDAITPLDADAAHGHSQQRLSLGVLAVSRRAVGEIDRLLSQLMVSG